MAHRTDGPGRSPEHGAERTPGAVAPDDPEPRPLTESAARELFAERAPLGLVRVFSASVPLVVDGEAVEDEERLHADLAGPLHLTPLGSGDELVLAGFTDRGAMLAEARRAAVDGPPRETADGARRSFERVCTSNPDSLADRVCFFEDAGEGGDVKCLGPGLGYPNLSRVHRGFLSTQNWNDVISSLSWCRFDVSLFDAFDWQGNEFFARKGCNVPDLNRFGWGDRAASIANWGT